jgi:hypothetical protein
LQFSLDGALVGRIQRRGGFIEDQDRLVFEQGAGDAGSSTTVKQNQLKTILLFCCFVVLLLFC